MNLSAQSVTIQNGGVLSASTSGIEPSATGGHISVSANQSVTLSNGGSIIASSTGPANAGNITINAGAQFLSQNASLTTTANQASGGNITIQATDSIRLVNSQLSTSVQGGPNTAGGNIIARSGHRDTPKQPGHGASGAGAGGNINIVAGTFLADQTSVGQSLVSIRVERHGEYSIPRVQFERHLGHLPQRPLQAQHLFCVNAARPR